MCNCYVSIKNSSFIKCRADNESTFSLSRDMLNVIFYLHINLGNFIILGLTIQAQKPQCIIEIQKTPEKYIFSKWE